MKLLAPLRGGLNPMRGSCQLLIEVYVSAAVICKQVTSSPAAAGLNMDIWYIVVFLLICIAEDVLFQNQPDGLSQPLRVLHNSRWRPRWPPFYVNPLTPLMLKIG